MDTVTDRGVHRRRAVVAALAMLTGLSAAQGCGGGAARSSDARASLDNTIQVTGTLSRRGSTPFALMMLETRVGPQYIIRSSRIGDELRQLEGMEVAVSGVVRSELDGEKVIDVEYYDLLRLSSGEQPIVGILRRSGDGVWIVDESQVRWRLEGDFREVLAAFSGAKVWVVGVVSRANNLATGSFRELLVTSYGVIRP